MEVKDVPKLPVKASSGTPRQIPGRSLAASLMEVPRDNVVLEVERRPTQTKNEVRTRTNEVISVAHIAAEATAEIEKLVKSIGGIVEQVRHAEVPETRRSILEREANGLVEEIQKRATSSTPSGLRPLAGDKIRFEIEEKLGKTLEFILPSDAAEAFGIGPVRFSTRETILNTIASVEAAQERLERLRTAVAGTVTSLHSTVSELEVAQQNSEASEASLRDVNDALDLAGRTGEGIASNPESALKSVGDLSGRALTLLIK